MLTTMGTKIAKVPQLVPEEKAIKIAMQKMTSGTKFIRLEFRLMAERTKVPIPRASVIPFRVQASTKIRMAGIISLPPSGTEFIKSLKPMTRRGRYRSSRNPTVTKPANTNASEEEQLAKSSTRFWPPFRWPVQIIAAIAVAIMTTMGAIRSMTLPLAYLPPSVGSFVSWFWNSSPPEVNRSPLAAFSSCFFIRPKSKPTMEVKNTIYRVKIA